MNDEHFRLHGSTKLGQKATFPITPFQKKIKQMKNYQKKN